MEISSPSITFVTSISEYTFVCVCFMYEGVGEGEGGTKKGEVGGEKAKSGWVCLIVAWEYGRKKKWWDEGIMKGG